MSSAYVVFITVRNEVVKVMFLHLSVSHSVHGGVPGQVPKGPGTPPGPGPPSSRYTPRQAPPRQVPPG